jgi:hypothetical protein
MSKGKSSWQKVGSTPSSEGKYQSSSINGRRKEVSQVKNEKLQRSAIKKNDKFVGRENNKQLLRRGKASREARVRS